MSRLWFLRNIKNFANIVIDSEVIMDIYQYEDAAPQWIQLADWDRDDWDYIIVPASEKHIEAAEELAESEGVCKARRYDVGDRTFFVAYHA